MSNFIEIDIDFYECGEVDEVIAHDECGEHEDVTFVRADRLEKLQRDSDKLAALFAAGVDNWVGYDQALDILEEMMAE